MEVKVNFMSSINKGFFIFSFLLVFSISTVFAGNLGTASLATGKTAYVKGDTVVIRGEGFGRFEDVSLAVENYNESLGAKVALVQWNVYTDKRGTFTASVPFDSLSSSNGRYIITASGSRTGTTLETNFSELLPNPAADLDQCANGPFSGPFVPCSGSAWQNGNVGQSQGHYYEGDAIPYRIVFTNLTLGTHTVTIQYDTTKGGKHAIDYLTTYTFTESSGNNPCSGVASCGTQTTFPIPLDPNVSGAGVTQIGGQLFTMWGGQITSVSPYVLTGSYAGDSSTAITITFTANQPTVVLAWAGHIADRNDWATQGGSASDITGSPYHTRLLDLDGSGGNQDRSLSNVAVRLASRIVIIKQAAPESSWVFNFLTTGTGLSNFSLVDDGNDNDATPNNKTFNTQLGTGQTGNYTVTENFATNGQFDLTNITCGVQAGGTSTFTTNVQTGQASIALKYGDTVTCTFNNAVVTAANVSAAGRVTDAYGNGIARTYVTIQNTANGETRTIQTNGFGYYRFDELPAGNLYVITVFHKRYTFENSSQAFQLDDAVENIDFVASPQ
jgi:hypothetical protein